MDMMDDFRENSENFWNWLLKQADVYLSPKIALHDYRSTSAGRGVIATRDIAKNELLFSIPANTTLSPRTSSLKTRLPELDSLDSWMQLILVMLFENQHPSSSWKQYFEILPVHFDTPMFWTEDELKELKGTEILPRIGKQKSEEQYTKQLRPLITSHPELFDPEKCDINAFHRMGSLVLAYSFGSTTSSNNGDDEDDSEDEEGDAQIAMVPLADMLNADPFKNNARLFQEGTGWEMRSIKPINKGDQIYNTYGNLPNHDLLRRYGYVLPGSKDDLVEISSDLILQCISKLSEEEVRRRLELLDDEEIYDEAYEIPYSGKIPEEMYIFCLSIMQQDLSEKSIPKIQKTEELQNVVLEIFSRRMNEYDTSLEEDEELLKRDLTLRKRMALEVRLSEKRILRKAKERVDAWVISPPTKRQKQT